MIVNHHSKNLDENPGLLPIWYDKVEEVCDEGKTEYTFKKYFQDNIIYEQYGKRTFDNLYHLNTPFSKGPQLTSKTVYKSTELGTYEKVEEENYEYKNIQSATDSVVPYFKVYRNFIVQSSGSYKSSDEYESALRYDPQDYLLHLKTEQLQSVTKIQYYKDGVKTITERRRYVPGTSLIQYAILTDGIDSIRTDYCYVDSSSEAIRQFMKGCNITGVVISASETYKNKTRSYIQEMSRNGTSVRPCRVWLQRDGYRWNKGEFKYDNKGFITQMTDPSGLKIIWERDEVGNPVSECLGDNALVSTVTWKPLVGMTSVTTPNFTKKSFTYDSKSRLSSFSLNGKLMEQYEYAMGDTGNFILTKRYYNGNSFSRNYAYYDGRGENYLTQLEQPDGKFISYYTEYDQMGRPGKIWLPVSGPQSMTKFDIPSAALEQYGDQYPFQTLLYEGSQRNVLEKIIRPSEEWQTGKASIFRFATLDNSYSQDFSSNINTSSNTIRRYVATSNGVTQTGNYPAGALLTQTKTDEDGHSAVTYTDLRGLTLCFQNPASTYYVYNEFGQISYILPPGLSGTHNRRDEEMQQLAYWYDYDKRGRMVAKKLPGVREEYYIYDDADRIVAVQSADLAEGQWRIFGYDHLGRIVLTLDCSVTREQVEQFASQMNHASLDGGPLAGYTLSGLPDKNPEIVNASYYDNYDFVNSCELSENFNLKQPPSFISAPLIINGSAHGLLSGVFTGKGYEVYYYDTNARIIQRYATGYNSGRTTNTYNYSGLLATSIHEPQDEDAGVTIVRYTYDNLGRTVKTAITKSFSRLRVVDPGLLQKGLILPPPKEELLRKEYSTSFTATYNSLGQLESSAHGGGASRSYTYNPQGWLKNTSTEIFGKTLSETLHYESGKYPSFNGNISAKEWNNGRYDYRYDSSNRLTDAEFNTSAYPGDYSTKYTYDQRSNPLKIIRQGQIDPPSAGKVYCGDLDDLTLSYSGNRMTSIYARSNALDFEGQTGVGQNGNFKLEYDSAGRLTKDQSRRIRNIDYDNNGFPITTEFYDGNTVNDEYDGMGNLLATIHNEDTIYRRCYTGAGHIYANGYLQIERVPGGYFNYSDKKFYHYITDHLGNNIAVVDDDGKLIEQIDYYPNGEPWSESSHPFTYSDNERLHAYGQNQYDFHARRLISTILRFDKIDPLCESIPWHSPYNFCFGNPIRYTDHFGLFCSPFEAMEWADEHIAGDYTIRFEEGLWIVIQRTKKIFYARYENFDSETPGGVFSGAYCVRDNRSYLRRMFDQPLTRLFIPDAITYGIDVSAYISGLGLSGGVQISWILRGPHASLSPEWKLNYTKINQKIGLEFGAQIFKSESNFIGDVGDIRWEQLGYGKHPLPQYGYSGGLGCGSMGVDICNDFNGTMKTETVGLAKGIPVSISAKRVP
ncbi:MAG: hypothetical protein K2M07_06645 [Muribaculaceae bacterium]|nr:hypothetical protein [Muribaculaceae bacterium]